MTKLRTLIPAALALAVAGSAWAQSASAPLTRAQVKKETAEANKKGELAKGDVDVRTPPPMKSDKTRAQTRDETRKANKAGELNKPEAEGAKAEPKAASGKSRAAVKEETKAANKAGELNKPEVPTPDQKKK